MMMNPMEQQASESGQYMEEPSQEMNRSQMLMMALEATGGDLKTAMQLTDFLSKDKAPVLKGEERKLAGNVKTGLRALDSIAQLIEEGAMLGTVLPGAIQPANSKKLSTALAQASDVIGRMRSGGAISEDEMATFKSFLPQQFEDPETIKYKLGELYQLFNDVLPEGT
jgi:hypothetical protein